MRRLFALPAILLLSAACSEGVSSSAAALEGLSFSAGALRPAFDPAVHAYSAVLPPGTLNVTVTPTASSVHASTVTVSQDGGAAAEVASGQPSAPLAVPARGTQSVITVTAARGSSTASYTIQLTQADDDDATLSGLALTTGTLNPAFSSAITRYDVTVPNGTTGFKITPTATQGDVKSITVAQDGGTAATLTSGQQSGTLKPPTASTPTTVVIAVTAQNGYDTQSYTLNVKLSGNTDATLQSLVPSAGTLSPAFASATTSYTLAVPVGAASVKLTPTANNSSARAIVVSQDGGPPATVASGAASAALSVPAIGSTSTASVKVIAQDGVSSVTYSVVIKQNASNDAALAGLTISSGALTPAFSADVNAYTASVIYGTPSVTITPTAHALAVHGITVSQDGGTAQSVPSGTGSPALTIPAVGSTSSVRVVVTAQDGVTQRTYTITLSQQSGATATLSALAISAGTLTPVFSSGQLAYAATVPHGTASVTVTPTATDSHVHGITVSQDGGSGAAVTSGSASGALSVPAVGSTSVISVAVVSPDQAVTKTYTITINQLASTVSTLASLAPSAGSLTPSFSANVTSYAVTVPSANTSFTLTPTATDSTATLQLAQDGGTAVAIASGSASANLLIPAAGIPTAIAVTVTAQSGATTTYTVTVTRAYATDATLSALAVSKGTLSPAFSSGTLTYAVAVPFGTPSLTVTPTANSAGAKSIKVQQDSGTPATVQSGAASPALTVPAVGVSSTITVKVTAEDNATVGTYTLSLTQAAPDTDAALSSLTTSLGALSPVFAPDTASYTLSLPFGSASFTVTPSAEASDIQGIMVAQDSATPQAVGSGTASGPLNVPAVQSQSTLSVTVTAQSGATRTYQIVVTQAGRDDSTLSALTDSIGALTGFTPSQQSYSYSVPYQSGGYGITATTNDPLAMLFFNGAPQVSGTQAFVALAPGLNVVDIKVVSADATTLNHYVLQITEGPAPAAVIGVSANSAAVLSNDAAVDFGTAITVANRSVTFTIANSGNAALVISSASVTSGADYAITTPPASPVDPSGSTTMVVQFAPSAAGARPGAITLVNSSNNQPSFVINLTGTGVSAVSSIAVSSAGNATSIQIGATLQLTAAVAPADAAQTVTWSTGASSIASVDGNGLVTGLGIGSAVITATATDGSGVHGAFTVQVTAANVLSFLKQANGTTSASMSNGVITVSSTYGTSGNAFKFVSPNYYGTSANGFVALASPITGDFTMSATITLTTNNKVNNACGIGLGITTGFGPTDRWAYVLQNNGTTAPLPPQASPRYVSAAGTLSNGSPVLNSAVGTAVQMSFSRSGSNVTFGWGSNTTTLLASALTDGTTAYGTGPVYPAISFNNVVATVSNLLIKDGAGNTLFDSTTGTLSNASLTLSASTATVTAGASANLTATAIGTSGAVSAVTAIVADPTVASVSISNGASNSTVTVTGLKAGSTTVTVTNSGDANVGTNSKKITVNVLQFNSTDSYGSLAARAYPVPASTGAYTDGELALTFDSPPTLLSGGSVDLYAQSDGSLVDRIFFANETQTVNGVTMQVGSQLARVSGNTLSFTPHFGKLAYNTGYYVGVSTTALTGTLNGVNFTGLSNLSSVKTWSFTTRATPTLTTTVAVDGSQTSTADFRTVGGALMYLAAHPIGGATAVTVNIAAGTYIELVNYRPSASNAALTITVSGPAGNARGSNAIVQYTNGGNMNVQNGRASFYFAGANLVLQNLTLKNTGLRTGSAGVAQAETLYFNSGAGYTVAVNNSTFLSNQDTIQTSGRAWFYNSFIEGNTDFIWGTSDAALFENCDLHVVTDAAGSASYSIFVARTGVTGAATVGKGYVLLNSRVSVDSGMVASFGRDAGAGAFYDQVALVNNTFSGAGSLLPALWDTTTAPTHLGDSTSVGWKSSGNTGLGAESATTAANTAASIANQASEYDTRDHILNRVVTVSGGAPTGFAAASTAWDTSALATLWGAP